MRTHTVDHIREPRANSLFDSMNSLDSLIE